MGWSQISCVQCESFIVCNLKHHRWLRQHEYLTVDEKSSFEFQGELGLVVPKFSGNQATCNQRGYYRGNWVSEVLMSSLMMLWPRPLTFHAVSVL